MIVNRVTFESAVPELQDWLTLLRELLVDQEALQGSVEGQTGDRRTDTTSQNFTSETRKTPRSGDEERPDNKKLDRRPSMSISSRPTPGIVEERSRIIDMDGLTLPPAREPQYRDTSEGRQLIRLGSDQEKELTGFITFNVSAIVGWFINWTGELIRTFTLSCGKYGLELPSRRFLWRDLE